MLEIGPITQQEWPWLWERSMATGWHQLPPEQQAAANPAQVAHQVQQMLGMALSAPGAGVLMARAAGDPVGYLVVTVAPDELTGLPTGLFLDIWVEPAWRGRGISSRLTAAGEEHCRRLGLRLVRRAVAAHNQASLRHALSDGCVVERYILIKAL